MPYIIMKAKMNLKITFRFIFNAKTGMSSVFSIEEVMCQSYNIKRLPRSCGLVRMHHG